MVTITWLIFVGLAGGVFAVLDGVVRLRTRKVLAIIEIALAALFLISLIGFGFPLSNLALALLTLVFVIIQFTRRTPKRALASLFGGLSVILLLAWIVLSQGWVVVPGI